MNDRNGKMLCLERKMNETLSFLNSELLIFVSLVYEGSELKCGCDFTPATLTVTRAEMFAKLVKEIHF